MADQPTTTQTDAQAAARPKADGPPDYRTFAVAPFAPGFFAGQPADWAKQMVLDRAGVPRDNTLRKGLKDTDAAAVGDNIVRVPEGANPPAEARTVGAILDWIDGASKKK